MENTKDFKSGFVAIVGKPNVGKSTLLNKILKEKVAIVSPKPQTTRNKILGILNEPNSQIIFIDTPGVHKSQNKLDEYMQKSINSVYEDVDVVVLVIDGLKIIDDSTINFIKSFEKLNKKTILVVNKIDESNFNKMYPKIAKLNEISYLQTILPISAKTGQNVDVLIDEIKKLLTDNVKYFDDDLYTTQSERFIAGEIVREKALWLLQDEIPHGIATQIVEWKESENKVVISCDIIIEKKSHKQIIIGKDGEMLKNIGTKARIEMEKMLNKKVFLNLFVKVKEDWRNNSQFVDDFGYNSKDV